jgi:hypothetical protein
MPPEPLTTPSIGPIPHQPPSVGPSGAQTLIDESSDGYRISTEIQQLGPEVAAASPKPVARRVVLGLLALVAVALGVAVGWAGGGWKQLRSGSQTRVEPPLVRAPASPQPEPEQPDDKVVPAPDAATAP